jgi:putative ABC transport system ATP-binding protein
MALLQELHRGGATICMVRHDPHYTHFAERTVNVLDGQLAEVSIQPQPGGIGMSE